MTFVGEWAIDHGGPRREFFRLLAIDAKNRLFRGHSDRMFFITSVMSVQVSYYFNNYVCIVAITNTTFLGKRILQLG